MSKRTVIVLSLATLAAGAVFTLGFCATKPLPLRVGMTIKDPWAYFTKQVDAEDKARHTCRTVSLISPADGVYVYSTRLVLLGDRGIATRMSVYRFNTNGTVLSIATRWQWPIFDF